MAQWSFNTNFKLHVFRGFQLHLYRILASFCHQRLCPHLQSPEFRTRRFHLHMQAISIVQRVVFIHIILPGRSTGLIIIIHWEYTYYIIGKFPVKTLFENGSRRQRSAETKCTFPDIINQVNALLIRTIQFIQCFCLKQQHFRIPIEHFVIACPSTGFWSIFGLCQSSSAIIFIKRIIELPWHPVSGPSFHNVSMRWSIVSRQDIGISMITIIGKRFRPHDKHQFLIAFILGRKYACIILFQFIIIQTDYFIGCFQSILPQFFVHVIFQQIMKRSSFCDTSVFSLFYRKRVGGSP